MDPTKSIYRFIWRYAININILAANLPHDTYMYFIACQINFLTVYVQIVKTTKATFLNVVLLLHDRKITV